jgi:hypothetical protein
MKYALIHGERICEVTDAVFPVAPDLKWEWVADDTTTQDTFKNGEVVKYAPPAKETMPPSLEEKVDALLAKELDGDATKLEALRTKINSTKESNA